VKLRDTCNAFFGQLLYVYLGSTFIKFFFFSMVMLFNPTYKLCTIPLTIPFIICYRIYIPFFSYAQFS